MKKTWVPHYYHWFWRTLIHRGTINSDTLRSTWINPLGNQLHYNAWIFQWITKPAAPKIVRSFMISFITLLNGILQCTKLIVILVSREHFYVAQEKFSWISFGIIVQFPVPQFAMCISHFFYLVHFRKIPAISKRTWK